MNENYELNILTPDPSALQDVFNAHRMYDAPNEPIVLSYMTAQVLPYGQNRVE